MTTLKGVARLNFEELTNMDYALRAKLFGIKANIGFSKHEAARLESALGDTFRGSVSVESVRLPNGRKWGDHSYLRSELEECTNRWRRSRTEHRSEAWSISVASREDSAQIFHGADYVDLPLLPWSRKQSSNALDDRYCEYSATLGGSMRTMDVYHSAAPTRFPRLIVKRSQIEQTSPEGFAQSIKRWLMYVGFGVEQGINPGAFRRLDALHCLFLSSHLLTVDDRLPEWMSVQLETGAAGNGRDSVCLFREALGWSSSDSRKRPYITIPYYSLVYNNQKNYDIFSVLLKSSGLSPHELSCQIISLYLSAWWALFKRVKVIHMMPHAQNALLEVDIDGRPIGITIKDLRDADLVRRYQSETNASVRFHAVCRAYLRYQMTVHPVYYDSLPMASRELSWMMFNFSFQMCYNHVIRGIVRSAIHAGADASIEVDIAQMIGALAEGANSEKWGARARLQGVNTSTVVRALRETFCREWAQHCL